MSITCNVLLYKDILVWVICTDNGGRYTYQKQPSICQWNLEKLAEALSPCMPSENAAEGIKMYVHMLITKFRSLFNF